MQKQNLKITRKSVLAIITISIFVLAIICIKLGPIKGQVEEFLPIAQEVSIQFFYLKPSLDLSEDQITELSELKIKGGWLKMKSHLGKLYILRITPECQYESDNYFYVKTENKPDITRKTDEFVSQTTRNGKSFEKYLRYEDITQLTDLNQIYAISPLKYEISGNRISRKTILKDPSLSERGKFIVHNLPAGAKILDVNKLRKIELLDSRNSFRESFLGRIIPWLIFLFLLLLLLLNWKRLKIIFKRKFMAQKENLQEFGYIVSGNAGGDPIQFRTYLNGIYNGDLSDNSNAVLTDNKLGNINSNIKELEKEIEANKERIKEIKAGENLPMFDPIRFIISMIIFVGITIFSYFFYLSTINKALVVNYEGCDTKLNILPSSLELAQAINNSAFILVVPFTVFALGWILHLIIDNPKLSSRQRIIFMGSMLLITFALDFLLASYIHKNINAIKVYCGFGTTEKWYASTTFYIIIFMGFMVYIFWSLILNNILDQLEKVNKKRLIHKESEKLKLEIDYLKRQKDRQEKLLENKITNISGNIDQFHQGWTMFMNNFPGRFAENKKRCEEIRNEFNEIITIQHEI